MSDSDVSRQLNELCSFPARTRALARLHRLALIEDPQLRARFAAPVRLESAPLGNVDAYLQSIANFVPRHFAEHVTIDDGAIQLRSQEVGAAGAVEAFVDESGNEWILFIATSGNYWDANQAPPNLGMFVHELNTSTAGSVWIHVVDGDSAVVMLATGFTVRSSAWGPAACELASLQLAQVHAQVAARSADDPSDVSTLLYTKSLVLEQSAQSETPDLAAQVQYGADAYITGLPADMRNALTIERFDTAVVFKVPVSGRFGVTEVACLVAVAEHNTYGPGISFEIGLPGSLPASSAITLANRLNYDPDGNTIHTTPWLFGPWRAVSIAEGLDRFGLRFFGFRAAISPDFTTVSDHIEGLIREACVSWDRVDSEIAFQNIVERQEHV